MLVARMRRRRHAVLFAILAFAGSFTACGYAPLIPPAKDRRVTFEVKVEAPASLGPGKVRLWVPVPLAGDYQECGRLEPVAFGGEVGEHYDQYGNRMLYLEGTPPLRLSYALQVRRFAATAPRKSLESGSLNANSPWLASTPAAPLEAIRTKALFKTSRTSDYLTKARILFDMAVDEIGGALRGSGADGRLADILARGVADSFDRSVVLASALRSVGIPAYVEHGYLLAAPSQVPIDFERAAAWLRFEIPGMGFLPADPGRSLDEPLRRRHLFGGLDEDRIRIGRGRDLRLLPPQDGPLLPRFVAPYAERDGKPLVDGLVTTMRSFDPAPTNGR